MDGRPARIVPCDGCTVCCQGDAVLLHPECGDVANQYRTEQCGDGRLMLAHQGNGDCIYLDRQQGCAIWAKRPTVCRELDCRIFSEPELARMAKKDPRCKAMRKAAKRRMRRTQPPAPGGGHGPCPWCDDDPADQPCACTPAPDGGEEKG